MPTYCYTSESGETRDIRFPWGTAPEHVQMDDGFEGRRDRAAEGSGVKFHPGNWPMESEALAVHPDQVKEASMAADAAGVPTEFKKNGRVVFRSAHHRKKYCEAFGYFDRNAGYGDPTI